MENPNRQSQPSLLKEAFKIAIRNGTLLLFISFIMFSYYSLMLLADNLVLSPVLTNLEANSKLLPKDTLIITDPTLYKAMLKDFRSILALKFMEWSFLCLVLMFSVAASVYSTNEAYTAKLLGLKEMLTGLKGKIKRTLKTTIWMILISLATAALLFFTLVVVEIMTADGVPFSSTDLISIVLTLAVFCYVYVLALWTLSLVVSVLEENMSGLKAIYRASELMKGKRLKGYGLMLLLIFVTGTILMTFDFLVSLAAGKKAESVVWAVTILRVWPYCLMEVFVFAVYTLFYHECKMSHQVEEIPHLFAPVPAVADF